MEYQEIQSHIHNVMPLFQVALSSYKAHWDESDSGKQLYDDALDHYETAYYLVYGEASHKMDPLKALKAFAPALADLSIGARSLSGNEKKQAKKQIEGLVDLYKQNGFNVHDRYYTVTLQQKYALAG